MVEITVRFTGIFRILAGCEEKRFALEDGATVYELIAALRNHLPENFITQVVDPLEQSNRPYIPLLLLNRNHLKNRDELFVKLSDGDIVVFVPPMEGG